MTDVTTNRETALALFDNLAKLRFDAARALLTSDAVWWDPERGYFTTDEMVATSGPFAQHYVDGISVTIHGTTAEDDRVAIEAESYARLKNGSVYNNRYLFLVGMKDGLVALIKEYHHTLHAFEIVRGLG
jgi:ketosteroid isomerase-like protein